MIELLLALKIFTEFTVFDSNPYGAYSVCAAYHSDGRQCIMKGRDFWRLKEPLPKLVVHGVVIK